MSNRMNTVIDRLCPTKNFKFAKEKPKWISDDLIELMKNRDAALRIDTGDTACYVMAAVKRLLLNSC